MEVSIADSARWTSIACESLGAFLEFIFKFEKPDGTCRECRFKTLKPLSHSCSILDKEIVNLDEIQDWCPLDLTAEEYEKLFCEATKKLGW